MTLGEAIELLQKCGVPSPEFDARAIFEDIGGVPRTRLVFRDVPATDAVEKAIKRRAEREPLQYILGSVDFYKERYEVTPDCLIPRQETELLVELATELLPRGARFADLCTGSGCIAISTLKNTSETTAVAVDLSDAAITLAERNARANGVSDRIAFLKKDVLSETVEGELFAVLSNPPYVKKDAPELLAPEIAHEPRMAFIGGGYDGANFYRAIVSFYKDRIPDGGFILFEIGYDQGDALVRIAGENGMTAEIRRDLSGNDRLALLRRK